MANRHKVAAKKSGGEVLNAGGNPNVEKEAKARKQGGRTTPALKTGGTVPGRASGGRLDKRARGGGVGADKSPFSSAHMGHKKGGRV